MTILIHVQWKLTDILVKIFSFEEEEKIISRLDTLVTYLKQLFK